MKKESIKRQRLYREKLPGNSVLELDRSSPFMGPHKFLYHSHSSNHRKTTQLDYPAIKVMKEPSRSDLLQAANRIIKSAYLLS